MEFMTALTVWAPIRKAQSLKVCKPTMLKTVNALNNYCCGTV